MHFKGGFCYTNWEGAHSAYPAGWLVKLYPAPSCLFYLFLFPTKVSFSSM